MAFDAYAVSGNLDDPLNQVLLTIGSKTEDLDGKLADLLARLARDLRGKLKKNKGMEVPPRRWRRCARVIVDQIHRPFYT